MKERVLFEIFRGTTCEKAETCYVLPDSIVLTQQIYIYIFFFFGGEGGGGEVREWKGVTKMVNFWGRHKCMTSGYDSI